MVKYPKKRIYQTMLDYLRRKCGAYLRAFGFAILFLIAIVYLVTPRARLYHADLQTSILTFISVKSDQNQWLLPDLSFCEIDLETMLFSEAGSAAQCIDGEPQKLNSLFQEPVLKLNPDVRSIIQWSLRDGLRMELKAPEGQRVGMIVSASGEGQKVLGERVVLTREPAGEEPSRTLTLTFEGHSIFGTDARLGTTAMLRSGTISAYEESSFWLWNERYLAGENTLSLGDTLRFVDNHGNDAIVKGFMRISPNEEGIEQGINVIAYSNVEGAQGIRDSTSIKIFRFGSDGYVFSPTLWARLENAPDIIFIVSILGLLLALTEVYGRALGFFGSKPEEGVNSDKA